MAISNPQLPPKSGYVEIVDSNGNHIYKPTGETLHKQQESIALNSVIEILNALLGVTE